MEMMNMTGSVHKKWNKNRLAVSRPNSHTHFPLHWGAPLRRTGLLETLHCKQERAGLTSGHCPQGVPHGGQETSDGGPPT